MSEAKEVRKAPAQAVQAQGPAVDTKHGEDWHLDMKQAEPADPKLEGLYTVKHGILFFSTSKVVAAGRRVHLTAEDAKGFLEQGLVERVQPSAQ